jgi:competence protein ComEA
MLERFRVPIFGAIIIAIAAGIVALLSYRPAPTVITIMPPPPSATPAPSATPVPTATPGPIKVYLTGAVVNAGKVYTLAANSRVEDAVSAAGGLTSDADSVHINMAQVLHDGDQVNVPSLTGTASTAIIQSSGSANSTPDTTTAAKSGKSNKATKDDPVHINTATLDDLKRLPGVGPSLAQKILDYRTQHGAFKSMDDLSNVSGIGPSKVKDWDGLVVFD